MPVQKGKTAMLTPYQHVYRVTSQFPFRRSKRAKAQVETDVLLMRRDRGLALGVLLDERRVEGNLMGDEREQIVQDF